MTFAWPDLLWIMFAPAALLAWDLTRRRRARSAAHPNILRAEAGAHSLTFEAPAATAAPPRTARPRIWLCLGLALGVVALARPQWGATEEQVFDQSREIVLALDLSRSMLTPDVKPARLERAKLLIQSLLDGLAGERVGLVVFSGTAFLQSPMSADYEILRELLPALKPDFLPEAGTNYGALIDTAAGAFTGEPTADRFLIVLSDGGATDDDWRDHLDRLKQKGIRVIGLGVGTAAGDFIPDGTGGFLKDGQGAVVLSKLESDNLRELSDRTGGSYRDASEWIDLNALLKSTVESGKKGKFVEKNIERRIERYQWMLAPALLCLLASFWREFPVRPRPRDLRLAASGGSAAHKAKSAVAAAGAAAIAFFWLGLIHPLSASAADTAAQPPSRSALLGRIVGRVASEAAPRALDWSELAGETVSWGQESLSQQHPVPPGPVHDALAAVDAGSALDPKAADWPKLRGDLEALLKKPEQKPEDQKKQDQQQPKDDQQQEKKDDKQDSKPQDQKSQDQKQQDEQQKQQQDQQKKDQEQKQQQKEDSSPTQRVGGAPQHPKEDPAAADPSLTMPLQKLDDVRAKDSPGELFKIMENNQPRPPANQVKPW